MQIEDTAEELQSVGKEVNEVNASEDSKEGKTNWMRYTL